MRKLIEHGRRPRFACSRSSRRSAARVDHRASRAWTARWSASIANNPMFGGIVDREGGAQADALRRAVRHVQHPARVPRRRARASRSALESEADGDPAQGVRARYLGMQVTVPVYHGGRAQVLRYGGRRHDRSRAGSTSRSHGRPPNWGSLPIEGGVKAAYRREIEAAPDPATARAGNRSGNAPAGSPFRTAEAFAVEDLIDPRETRPVPVPVSSKRAWPGMRTRLGPKARTGVRP